MGTWRNIGGIVGKERNPVVVLGLGVTLGSVGTRKKPEGIVGTVRKPGAV